MRSCFHKQGIKQYAIIEMLDKTYKSILWEHTNDQQYFYVVHDYEDISVWKLFWTLMICCTIYFLSLYL